MKVATDNTLSNIVRRPDDTPEAFSRRSVTFEPDVDRAAHEIMGASGFSAYVNQAVKEKLRRDQMLALLRDLDAEFGPVDPAIQREVDAEWKRLRSTREH